MEETLELLENAVMAFNDVAKGDLPITTLEARKYAADSLKELADHILRGGATSQDVRLVIVEN